MFKSFIKPVCKVTHKTSNMSALTARLQDLAKRDVLIGIPQEKSSRPGEEPTNAELAYIHEHGSPMKNIPPRPFLGVAVWENRDKVATVQRKIIRDVLNGQGQATALSMHKLGLLGQNLAKGWFVDTRNNWAPNAPLTIALKGSDKPLIDTGALRQAITYAVREDKA